MGYEFEWDREKARANLRKHGVDFDEAATVFSDPLSVLVETFGTETIDVATIEKAVLATFDLRPGAIIRDLDLRRPIYRKTAAYGHFGRDDADFTWERTERLEALKAAAGL